MKLNSVQASEFLVKALPQVGKTREQWTQWLGHNRDKGSNAQYAIPFTCAGKGPLGCRLTKISYEKEDLENFAKWMLKSKSLSRNKLGLNIPKSKRGTALIEIARQKLLAQQAESAKPVLAVLAVEPAHHAAVPAQRFAVSCLLKGAENGKIDQELSVEAGSSENEAIGIAVMSALNKSGGNLALLDISCVPVR